VHIDPSSALLVDRKELKDYSVLLVLDYCKSLATAQCPNRLFGGFYSVLLRVSRRQNGSAVAFVDPHLYNSFFSFGDFTLVQGPIVGFSTLLRYTRSVENR
jgi:hypothetical protein